MYNLDEREREIFYKTMKKIFFPTYSVLEKSVYHLSVAIFVELPIYLRPKLLHIKRFISSLSYSKVAEGCPVIQSRRESPSVALSATQTGPKRTQIKPATSK